MGVPTIALYASPPSSVCSTPHPCQITSHSSHDFELGTGKPSSAPHCGLSSLFSSQGMKYAASTSYQSVEEDDRSDELSCSFRYSSYSSLGSSLKKDQSPVSVFQGPVSCSSSSRSPTLRIRRERTTADGNLHCSFRAGAHSLFNGFAPNALGSCVDYDSPTFQAHCDPFELDSISVLGDELPFIMDDAFAESKNVLNSKHFLLDAQSRHMIFYDDFVVKAFHEAEKAHRGQVRASGDPYLQHCVETAVLLARIGASSTVVAAGLLHDTLDDSFMSYDHIFRNFGTGVAELVEGVSKLSHLSKLARDNNTACKTVEADRLHTMFLAMTDVRAVLIKLADRLHNMKTLDALPLDKQQRISKETLEIFAPLANRLGISSWKEQLENLCFQHLYPEQYRNLSSKLVKSYDEAMITCASEKLEGALKDECISYHVLSGRHKSLYGIHAKMLKKKVTMDEVHDIHGLRLIVEKKEDCYKALKVVNQLWTEVPGKFKDYIDHPKFNGYESLHTVVRVGEGMVPLEVQIRTKEMHLQAEIGFAAHWRYKEGDQKHASFVLQMVEWARWVISWQCETKTTMASACHFSSSPPRPYCKFPSHEKDCWHTTYRHDCFPDGPIFVIMVENGKMSVQEFPAGSRLSDMLESKGHGRFRWSPDGFPRQEELRPSLNSKPINDPSCKLMMGDVIELTPVLPDKSLTEYREEMQRMYDHNNRDLHYYSSLPTAAPASTATSTTCNMVIGWRT